jgi:hypothetical protein
LEIIDRPAALVLVENIMPQNSCPLTLGRKVKISVQVRRWSLKGLDFDRQ